MAIDGTALRRRRERLGLSLEQVSDGTKVPVDYLRALESGDVSRIPQGPYAERYASAVDALLSRVAAEGPMAIDGAIEPSAWSEAGSLPTVDGEDAGPLSEPVIHTRPVPAGEPLPEPRVPVALLRRVATVTMVIAGLLIVWETAFRWKPWRAVTGEAPAKVVVRVKVRENARLSVRVDGLLVEDRVFAGREEATWSGRERVELDLPRLDLVAVSFNGRNVDPRGEQDHPRTLTFIDDAGTR